jgi:hypothetical protein
LYNSTVPRDRLTSEGPTQLPHRGDAFWWLAAGALSVAAARFPDVAYPGQEGTPQLVSHVVLFLVGCLMGTFCSRRPWRWGVAAFLALGIADILHVGGHPGMPVVTLEDVWAHVIEGAGDWGLHAVPVLIGAYAGALLSRKGVK